MVLAEAGCLGLIGVAVGLVVGLLVYWPFSVYGVTIGGAEAYGVSFDRSIKFDLDPWATVELSVVFWLLTVLTALGTARRAARINPVEALRHL
jgi:ABC-type antimicrobial peptide transport system permease subunit